MPVTRHVLSGSTAGRPIVIVATASPGTLLHTAGAGLVAVEEVWLELANSSNQQVSITVEWGGTAAGDRFPETFFLPPRCPPIFVATGAPIQNALEIRAYASVASVVRARGFLNRIS